jgi:hypothetical protein
MSFPPGTEMFQFPGFALLPLCIQGKVPVSAPYEPASRPVIRHCQVGCPIRKSMDQRSFSPPHGLSQSITSFIASCCQGIHQTPFSRLIWSGKSRTEERPFALRSAARHPHRCWAAIPVRSHTFLSRPDVRQGQRLVYLTWNKTARGLEAQVPHTRGPAVLMFLSLHDVNPRPFGRQSAAVLHSAIPTPGRAGHAGRRWWVEMDSNHRPYAYQAYALTT